MRRELYTRPLCSFHSPTESVSIHSEWNVLSSSASFLPRPLLLSFARSSVPPRYPHRIITPHTSPIHPPHCSPFVSFDCALAYTQRHHCLGTPHEQINNILVPLAATTCPSTSERHERNGPKTDSVSTRSEISNCNLALGRHQHQSVVRGRRTRTKYLKILKINSFEEIVRLSEIVPRSLFHR